MKNKKLILFWFLTALYCMFLFYLSSFEGSEIREKSPENPLFKIEGLSDKLEHLALYFVLGLLVYTSFQEWNFSSPEFSSFLERLNISLLRFSKTLSIKNGGIVLMTVTFSFFYGITDELHQYFVPGRTASAFDLLVDAAGAFLAAIFLEKIRNKKFS